MHSHIRPYLPSKSPSWNKLRQLSVLDIWPTSEAMTLLEQGDRGQNWGLCGWVMLGPQFFGWFCWASNPGVISQRGFGYFKWINMIQINWEKISTYTVTYPALYWMFCNRGSLIVQKSAGEFLVDRFILIIYRVSTIQGGAGFLPSTVSQSVWVVPIWLTFLPSAVDSCFFLQI